MKVDRPLYFEDFAVGQVYETDTWTLSEEDIIEFGEKYAPLPYHTDPVAAKETSFGGLVAAGFQTVSITFSLFVQTGALSVAGMGSPGVDSLRWKLPVKPGDTLRVLANVIEVSPAQKEGGRNAIRLRYDTLNQNDETVMTLTSLHFVRSRDA